MVHTTSDEDIIERGCSAVPRMQERPSASVKLLPLIVRVSPDSPVPNVGTILVSTGRAKYLKRRVLLCSRLAVVETATVAIPATSVGVSHISLPWPMRRASCETVSCPAEKRHDTIESSSRPSVWSNSAVPPVTEPIEGTTARSSSTSSTLNWNITSSE